MGVHSNRKPISFFFLILLRLQYNCHGSSAFPSRGLIIQSIEERKGTTLFSIWCSDKSQFPKPFPFLANSNDVLNRNIPGTLVIDLQLELGVSRL